MMPDEQNLPGEKQRDEDQKPGGVNESISPRVVVAETEQGHSVEPDATGTINAQLQTPNMEVHHHSDLHDKKKNWKQYSFEFLMIFFAVTMGFFAENIRERIIDHRKEKEYIKSMLEDLKADTSQLSATINLMTDRETTIDSLIILLARPDFKKYGNEIYYFARNLSIGIYYFSNDGTIQQLKNAGGLSLIRDIRIADNIMSYDQKSRSMVVLFNSELTQLDEYRRTAASVFDGNVFNAMIDKGQKENKFIRPNNNPQLFTEDPRLINELINRSQYLKNLLRTLKINAVNLEVKGADLIKYLQIEYK